MRIELHRAGVNAVPCSLHALIYFCRTGSTALMQAVEEGHESIVQLLLEHEADVNAADE